jgi:hypothetical protein
MLRQASSYIALVHKTGMGSSLTSTQPAGKQAHRLYFLQMAKTLARLKPYRVEILLVLLAVLPHIVISLSNPNTVLDWYSSDDGFYYFQVARNLAAGHGFTFDGLNLTNGFHPLWLFLITPLFLFAQLNLLLPLRLLIILSALLSAGSAILLYRILRRYTAEGLAALVGLLWIIAPRVHDITQHAGVEAGLNAFCILFFWHAWIAFSPTRNNRETLRGLAALGLLATLAVLSRLDNIFLVFFGGLWLWLRLWRPQNATSKKAENPWAWRGKTGFAFFGPIAVIMLAYLIWNQLGFGTPTPVSGQIKVWWGTLRNTVYGFPVRHIAAFWGQFVTNDPELGPWSLLTAPLYVAAEGLLNFMGQGVTEVARRIVLLALGGTLGVLVTALIWKEREFFSKAVRSLGLLPFFLGCLIQVVYYKVSGSVAQQPWYWVAEMLLILLGLGLLLNAVWLFVAPHFKKRRSQRGYALTLIALAILTLNFLAFVASAIRAPGDGSNHFYIDRAAWLQEHTEEGARIAITGAGNLAYFIQGRTVINMDGLMNSYDYFLAIKTGNGAQFLANEGVAYIFGNEYILTQTNPYAPMLEGHLEPLAVYTFADRELPLWHFIP